MQSIRAYIDEPTYLSEAELHAILHARDWQQLRERVMQTLAVFGIEDFLIRIQAALPDGDLDCHVEGSVPLSLLDRFANPELDELDPVNRQVLESGLPKEWHIDDVCAATDAPGYLQLRMRGVRRGISMAIRTERTVARIDFLSRSVTPLPRSAAFRANLLLLATHVHETARTLYNKQVEDRIEPLTERELECLRFSAGGKTGKEIGQILGISQRTVYFHMKNISRKFKVYSTRHAIGRAVAVGLIKPGN